jgi:hypothetical protein
MEKAIMAAMADVMQQFSDAYIKNYPTSPQQLRLVHDILACRTQQLGSHTSACTGCGEVKTHYNSCGNRGCPNCQGTNKEKWILERTHDLLPVKHFHMVFTLPAQLRGICFQNQKLMYNLLFKCAWQTLDTFSKDPAQKLEAKMGMVAVLHTWTQQLGYHPHVHCIVPAGGIAPDGKWKHTKSKGKFLFHVKALAKTFCGKFMEQLLRHHKAGDLCLEGKLAHLQHKDRFWEFKKGLYEKEWVVYAKEAFGNPASVVEYLGRYTHKIAISNHRILAVDDKTVSFSYLDRKANRKEICTLPGEKFIARFLLHVLPKGYTKIRHYGFFATRVKTRVLPAIREKLGMPNVPKPKYTVRDVLMITKGIDPLLCSTCGSGILVTIAEIPRPRGSPLMTAAG